jgi:hypothetical protein
MEGETGDATSRRWDFGWIAYPWLRRQTVNLLCDSLYPMEL